VVVIWADSLRPGRAVVNLSGEGKIFAPETFDHRETREIHEKESGFAYFAYFAVATSLLYWDDDETLMP